MRYNERLSSPLLDRLDIFVNTRSLEYDKLREHSKAENSAAIRNRVNAAREIQSRRYKGSNIRCNAFIDSKQLEKICHLSSQCEKLMRSAFNTLLMTARSYDRIIKIARTVADLEGSESIAPEHLAEALQYRSVSVGK